MKLFLFSIFLFLFLIPITVHDAPLMVDTELIVMIDTSASIKTSDYFKQSEIIRNTFRSPNVLRTIQSNFHQQVAVIVIEFAGYEDYRETMHGRPPESRPSDARDFIVTIPWIILASQEDIEYFINLFPERRELSGNTHTARAMNHALDTLQTNGIQSTQKAINVFTDGHSSNDRELQQVMQERIPSLDEPTFNVNAIVMEPSSISGSHDDFTNNLYRYAHNYLKHGPKGRVIFFDDFEMEKLLIENFSMELM